jgi:hypothetical protein
MQRMFSCTLLRAWFWWHNVPAVFGRSLVFISLVSVENRKKERWKGWFQLKQSSNQSNFLQCELSSSRAKNWSDSHAEHLRSICGYLWAGLVNWTEDLW